MTFSFELTSLSTYYRDKDELRSYKDGHMHTYLLILIRRYLCPFYKHPLKQTFREIRSLLRIVLKKITPLFTLNFTVYIA